MDRQLDETAGYLLQMDLEKRGIRVITKANTKEIIGNGAVEKVLLDDGTELKADMVLMTAGIRPAVQIAHDAGLAMGRAIIVDAQMRTSEPDIYAVGECVEFEENVFGLVAPLYDQARVLANTLLDKNDSFKVRELSTKLKVTGCDLFSAGDFADGEGREDIVFSRSQTQGLQTFDHRERSAYRCSHVWRYCRQQLVLQLDQGWYQY